MEFCLSPSSSSMLLLQVIEIYNLKYILYIFSRGLETGGTQEVQRERRWGKGDPEWLDELRGDCGLEVHGQDRCLS